MMNFWLDFYRAHHFWFVAMTKPQEIAWYSDLDLAALVILCDNLNVVLVKFIGAPKFCLASSALTEKGNTKEMLDLANVKCNRMSDQLFIHHIKTKTKKAVCLTLETKR